MGVKSLVFGVGINDWDCRTVMDNGHPIPEYKLWKTVLLRCFGDKNSKILSTYGGVSCDESWLSMRKFIEDVSSIGNYDMAVNSDWAIDKDILIPKNRIYSIDTVCFVPKQINNSYKNYNRESGLPCGVYSCTNSSTFFAKISIDGRQKYLGTFNCPEDASNAFKIEKEKYVKLLADRWKGVISENVYNSMVSYNFDDYNLATLSELKGM